jgi:hypothetical protein
MPLGYGHRGGLVGTRNAGPSPFSRGGYVGADHTRFQEGDETGLQPLLDHCFGRFETRMANKLAERWHSHSWTGTWFRTAGVPVCTRRDGRSALTHRA